MLVTIGTIISQGKGPKFIVIHGEPAGICEHLKSPCQAVLEPQQRSPAVFDRGALKARAGQWTMSPIAGLCRRCASGHHQFRVATFAGVVTAGDARCLQLPLDCRVATVGSDPREYFLLETSHPVSPYHDPGKELHQGLPARPQLPGPGFTGARQGNSAACRS